MKNWAAGLAVLLLALPALGLDWVSGSWSLTMELLPTTQLYSSELDLTFTVAGWEVESESKLYSSSVFKYQNFYLSGYLGDWDVWGKIYFDVQDVRYQKAWLNFERQVGDGTLRLSVDHWASEDDYWSSDEDMFGPWPCNTVSWEEAWRHIGRTLNVEGPVVGYYSSGYLKLNIGRDYPDPDRFEIYIPASYVDDFEAVFGDDFWVDWASRGQVVCVHDTIEGYRWTYGGPRNEGYSVAQAYLTDPADLSLGGCCESPSPASCPGQVIRWFEAHMHDGETLWIQGPVASITGPGTYYGYTNVYRVRVGGGSSADNRVEVLMASDPGWPTVGSSYDTVVCIYGKITMHGDIAVIEPPDLVEAREGPCCEGRPFIAYQMRYTWDPFEITVNFGDCCTGIQFKSLEVAASGLSLCCGLTYDAELSFSKCHGFESFSATVSGLELLCCDISLDLSVEFTTESKTISISPSWGGIAGCFSLYGDVNWDGTNLLDGLEIWGFGISCYLEPFSVTIVSALNPDKVEDVVDTSFYSGEWEYLGLEYVGPACCGGDLSFIAEFWFGDDGVLFGIQRTKYYFELPLADDVSVFLKAQWDFSDPAPLDWFDIGWDISF